MNTIPQLPVFKIRCSGIGKIMSQPKTKSAKQKCAELYDKLTEQKARLLTIKPTLKSYGQQQARIEKTIDEMERLLPFLDLPHLSQACISFLHSWVNERVYERKIEVHSKMMDKGNLVEDDAIVYACGIIPEMGLASKNLEHFSDDWMHGTPDVVVDEEHGYVFDTKCSWNHDTFPLYDPELPEEDYRWQVLGYMELTGKRFGRVVFALMSMPDEMLEREARWKLGVDHSRDEFNQYAAQFRYDDFPPHLRLKEFEILWDEEAIQQVRARVEECRAYINKTILPMLAANMEKYS